MAMRNSNNQSTRYMSTLQENYIAKKFGGKVCPNSGAGKWQKSDVWAYLPQEAMRQA